MTTIGMRIGQDLNYIGQDLNYIGQDLNYQRRPSRPSLLDSYRQHRAVRREYAEAERELASYTSPAELDEISEMLLRSDSTESAVYRRVVDNMRFRAA